MTRAQALLASPTPENLRYAALELRLCIEALTYEKLRSFSSLVPEEVLQTWQPPQAVKALLEFEPHADQSFTVLAGVEEEYGKPAKEMKFVGQHASLRLNWVRKHYNKLGNLLHAPTLAANQQRAATEVAAYLLEVIADLQAPLSGNITGGSIREVLSFACEQCHNTVVCNAQAVRKNLKATCLNPQCKAEYFASFSAEGEARFQLMVTTFECMGDGCDGAVSVENRKLDVGAKFTCPKCGLKHVIVTRQWGYRPIEKRGRAQRFPDFSELHLESSLSFQPATRTT